MRPICEIYVITPPEPVARNPASELSGCSKVGAGSGGSADSRGTAWNRRRGSGAKQRRTELNGFFLAILSQ
jgi:hypothetical protein